MVVNFTSMCRLCMAEKGTLLPLFDEGSLLERVLSLIPVLKMFAGDGLPAQVCDKCVHQVNELFKFKVQCISSDTTLRQVVSEQDVEKSTTENSDICWTFTEVKEEINDETVFDENSERVESSDDERLPVEADFLQDNEDIWSSLPSETSSGTSSPKKKLPFSETRKVKVKTVKIGRKSNKNMSTQKNSKSGGKECVVQNEEIKSNTVQSGNVNLEKWLSQNEDCKQPNMLEDSHLQEEKLVSNEVPKGIPHSIIVDPLQSKPKPVADKKRFLCHDCGKIFTLKHQLQGHLRTHTGEKPYCCSICEEAFGFGSSLRKHMRIHTLEKPYLCTVCGRCFSRGDTLTKHMRGHTGEKPYHCTVCGNNFGRRSTLINHLRAHMGEKRYLCTECGWRCVQSYDLTKHMRCHSGEKPVRCKTEEKYCLKLPDVGAGQQA